MRKKEAGGRGEGCQDSRRTWPKEAAAVGPRSASCRCDV